VASLRPFASSGHRVADGDRTFFEDVCSQAAALRLDPVRLLIAEDVGIGKMIEADLIAQLSCACPERRPSR
jgi:hypothetical protein